MNNWDLIEKNEFSRNANGGTELFMRGLYDGEIPREPLQEFQIIPGRVRELNEEKIRIYTVHDLPDDPECQKLSSESFRNQFHKIVFISNWQYQQFINKLKIKHDDNMIVIESAIDNSDIILDNKPKDVLNLSYFTTPHRGLSILCKVFEKLSKEYSDIHLHVHSSFKVYGWEDSDKKFEQLFDFCRNHPQITYYGYTPHEELMELIKNYHIFAYPCIWEETSCRAILEAMSAGLLPIHPNYGALPDSTGGLTVMYPMVHDFEKHCEIFYNALDTAITSFRYRRELINSRLEFNRAYVSIRYSPSNIKMKWMQLLSLLLKTYPSISSRVIKKTKPFIIDTSKNNNSWK
jgi:UDP-glucose:(glucosyl)LPS alpha-1,2-glucosyltransferase